MAGDLNCCHIRLNSHRSNVNGNALLRIEDGLTFDIIAPSEPTHFVTRHRPTVRDIALLQRIALPVRRLEVLHELDSDSVLVSFFFNFRLK